MKEQARLSFIQQLTKVAKEEDINLEPASLSDKELKELYLKLQFVRSGCKIGVSKDENFVDAMYNKTLMRLSFTDYHQYGVRRITFKEFLLLETFSADHPETYSGFCDLLNWRQK